MICPNCGSYTSWSRFCTSCCERLPHPNGPVDAPERPLPTPMPTPAGMQEVR